MAQQAPRRRQWGSDKHVNPMPAVPAPAGDQVVAFGRLAIVVTALAWIAFVVITVVQEFILGRAWTPRFAVEAVAYLLIVTLLTASSLAYLISRLGFFYRTRKHWREPRTALEEFSAGAPSITVLVPSYREEPSVVRTTLLSAALQEYPQLNIVLLVDDPPHPVSEDHKRQLETAREMPRQIEKLLQEPNALAVAARDGFNRRIAGAKAPTPAEMTHLASAYDAAVSWLNRFAYGYELADHADAFFADHVVKRLAADLATTALALRAASDEGVVLPETRLRALYGRLVAIFSASLSSFERKQYISCSHEPNKAMNLNSYIALMGGKYRDAVTPSGRALVPEEDGTFVVPNPDYVLTLDADSVLMPEYCLRIVHLMEKNEHNRVAVAQTPYSAYPGSATRIERIAGATTDLQHILHQGMTYYNATFWVGANAVLRKSALDEIVDVEHQGDWEIKRYIRDNTVIEDTESSIELGIHGWQLLNYTERLSYSATPPDFGSLCIQRRRWANGGLLILAKLRRQNRIRKSKGDPVSIGERFLRTNYLASITWSTLSLLLLLAYPFNDQLLSPLVLVVGAPYFLAMASDLAACGYKRTDVMRIYGFNLILLPVNLAGVGNSLLQALTGEKAAFHRTPKVRNRTAPPLLFVVAPYAVVALAGYTLVNDYFGNRWVNAVFAALNVLLATYAIVAFIGIRASIADIFVNVVSWLYVPRRAKPAKRVATVVPTTHQGIGDWASVLNYRPGTGALVEAAAAESEIEVVGSSHAATPAPEMA
jgi:cellulose synthase/poly-beta-1,6-N-acetylglucosamine synthase-like glycosyltransferase